MTIERRLENALRISKSIKDGKLGPNNLYDLNLHLSEALQQAEKLSIHSVLTRLDSLNVGDKYMYDLNDKGVFTVISKEDSNWIDTKRDCGRRTGSFPDRMIYPV